MHCRCFWLSELRGEGLHKSAGAMVCISKEVLMPIPILLLMEKIPAPVRMSQMLLLYRYQDLLGHPCGAYFRRRFVNPGPTKKAKSDRRISSEFLQFAKKHPRKLRFRTQSHEGGWFQIFFIFTPIWGRFPF